MSNDLLRFSGQASLSVGAFFQSDTTDLVWDGAAMVADSAALTLTRAATTPIPETGTSTGRYRAKMSVVAASLPVDKYLVTYYDLVGDPSNDVLPGNVVFQETIEWDGAALVDDLVTGQSVADICNLAISHLGVDREIANMTTDTSQEASACRRFFDTALEKTLRAFPWPFAIRIAALGLVEADPNDEWAYSYRYPTNGLYIRRILSGSRTDNKGSRVSSKIVGDDSGRLIYVDAGDAEIEYVAKVTNPLRFTPDFVMAFSLYLAFLIAPRISGSNQKFADRAVQLYQEEIMKAEASAANEDQPDETPDSELISERG